MWEDNNGFIHPEGKRAQSWVDVLLEDRILSSPHFRSFICLKNIAPGCCSCQPTKMRSSAKGIQGQNVILTSSYRMLSLRD